MHKTAKAFWLIGGILWGSCAWSQVPTLEQAIQISVDEFAIDVENNVTTTNIETRIATIDELTQALSTDADGDGTPSLTDACPVNPACSSPADLLDQDGDGRPAWGDVDDSDPTVQATGDETLDARPSTDDFSPILAAFDSPEDIVQAAFEENQEKELYPSEGLLAAISQAGFDEEMLQVWREQFVDEEPPTEEGCRKCRRRVYRECKRRCGNRRGRAKHIWIWRCVKEARQECREPCNAKATKIKEKILKTKKKLRREYQKPRRKQNRSRIYQLWRQLKKLFYKLYKIVWGW